MEWKWRTLRLLGHVMPVSSSLPLSPFHDRSPPRRRGQGMESTDDDEGPSFPSSPSPFPRSAARLPPVIKKREESREFTEVKFDETQIKLHHSWAPDTHVTSLFPFVKLVIEMIECQPSLERRSKSRWPRPKAASPPLYASQTAILIQRRLLPPPAYSAGRWGEKSVRARENPPQPATKRPTKTTLKLRPLLSFPHQGALLSSYVKFFLPIPFSALFSQSA